MIKSALKIIRHPSQLARHVPLDIRLKVRTLRNWRRALLRPVSLTRSVAAIAQVKRSLSHIAKLHSDDGRIPPVFHFCYLFAGSEEFPFYAYLAILSALRKNPGFVAVLHYCHEPRGEWWQKAKGLVLTNKVADFEHFRLARMYHYAHKADVIRLLALNVVGGIYLDLDTLTLRDFAPLRDSPFVMAAQPATVSSNAGFCNAVMMSRRGSEFSTRWLKEYSHFRSKGRDLHWDFHSVQLPLALYFRTSIDIRVISYSAFFPMLWDDTKRHFLAENSEKNVKYFDQTFVVHLWNSHNGDVLRKIEPEIMRRSTSLYAYFARSILEDIRS
jgi:Glycosyltransferase sugar-binding region containing DXD motif/Alpha 1,4-glycosyltransferase conserved region